MSQPEIAIIGGSGLYQLFKRSKMHQLTTPFGASATITIGKLAQKVVAFLPRHGSPSPTEAKSHAVPPHAINYRANLFALRKLGVRYILATTAVGSLKEELPPDQLVIPDQILDFTRSRLSTFFDGKVTFEVEGKPLSGVAHVDVTDPLCLTLRDVFLQSIQDLNLSATDGATYACMEGPRFETAAEIRMLHRLGADIVGMTLVPEAFLARELAMCYATCAVVTNYAAGLSQTPLTHTETVTTFETRIANVRDLLRRCVSKLPPEKTQCNCLSTLDMLF